MTLLEFLRSLIYDDEARQEFADNPDQALADAGLDHLSAADVHDALSLMQDDSQEADFSRDTDTGGNEINVAPPAPVESHDDGDTSSFGSGDANSAEFNGDVSLGDGAALGLGGDVSVDNSDSSTNDSFNDNSDNSTEDSFNDTSSYTDNSDNSTEDSFNDSSSHSESEYSSDDDSFSSS